MQRHTWYRKLWMWLSRRVIFLGWSFVHSCLMAHKQKQPSHVKILMKQPLEVPRESFEVYRKWRNIYWRKSFKPLNSRQHLSKSTLLRFSKLGIKWFALVKWPTGRALGFFLLYCTNKVNTRGCHWRDVQSPWFITQNTNSIYLKEERVAKLMKFKK